MPFNTSHISLTSKAEQLSLMFHNNALTSQVYHNSDPRKILERFVLSRLAGLLISPAAALDLIIHTVMIPVTCVYAIGKSIILKKKDFSIPWEHLERVRQTFAKIIFGSAFGLIHPYLGTYIAENKDIYFALGVLLSGSNTQKQTVIPPLSALKNILSISKNLENPLKFSKEQEKIVRSTIRWEKSLEEIQSIEFFDLKITRTVLGKIVNPNRDGFAQEVITRVSMLAYPIFALLDLLVYTATSAISIVTGTLGWLGGRTPAYLEVTPSPLLHIYNLAKIVIFAVGATIGFFVSFVSPELGLSFSHISSERFSLSKLLLKAHCVRLNYNIKQMKDKERLLLPIVINHQEVAADYSFLPNVNSHMQYLLLRKVGESYEAELIERGSHHLKSGNLNYNEVCQLAYDGLSLRFKSIKNGNTFLQLSERPEIDLGSQGNMTNCTITNFFAAFQVMNAQDKNEESDYTMTQLAFRYKTLERFRYLFKDFYAFREHDSLETLIESQNAYQI